MPRSKPMMPRAMIDEPVVAPSICKSPKQFVPICASGIPKSQSERDAQPVGVKCIDCDGCRVYGFGPTSKAKRGFVGMRFHFCMGCGRNLTIQDRAGDCRRIAMRAQSDQEFKEAVAAARRTEAERVRAA